MRLFFITFFLTYGGMHLYAFLKARAALKFGKITGICIIFFMIPMVLAPVIIRVLEKNEFELLARLLSFIGYTWMGIILLFFSASILTDLYRLILKLAGFIFRKDFSRLNISAKISFYIPLALSLCIAFYGYFEARNVQIEHIAIKTPKLPKETGRLRIVQISDVHLGLIIREERLKNILEQVKKADPDIFVSTGDLVDGQINHLDGLTGLFHEIKPRYGKFAITGNHEFIAGIDQSVDFMKHAGFTVLRAEVFSIPDLINIAGVDDSRGQSIGDYKDISEKELLSKLPREKFTLLLKHKPLIDRDAVGLFDLQLSGHVHKGQLFPFSLITKFYYPKHAGMLKSNNSLLYVNRGAGTWGPPIRFLSPPEVTVIELIHDGKIR